MVCAAGGCDVEGVLHDPERSVLEGWVRSAVDALWLGHTLLPLHFALTRWADFVLAACAVGGFGAELIFAAFALAFASKAAGCAIFFEGGAFSSACKIAPTALAFAEGLKTFGRARIADFERCGIWGFASVVVAAIKSCFAQLDGGCDCASLVDSRGFFADAFHAFFGVSARICGSLCVWIATKVLCGIASAEESGSNAIAEHGAFLSCGRGACKGFALFCSSDGSGGTKACAIK